MPLPTPDALCDDPAEQIRTLERQRLRALVTADIATAAALHADDFQLITPIGAALSKAQYLGAIANGHIDYRQWEPGRMTVRLQGDSACIRYQARLELVFGGHPLPPGQFWHTDIYERRQGQWQVVWSQATEIRDIPQP
ncbi:MAG: nuclear transport factor 2 family protein [Pseudomonas sp.]|uniref:nuclear transport factor 2 family protein n=1 Tax=Pseudomonas sp. TaxID=306 RepID=UPI00339330EC